MTKPAELFGILIVDDEPYVREGLKGLIAWESYGFTVCGEASDGQEAIGRIAELQPSLVITDVRMPEMDGLELIRRAVTELRLPCKFIILSGYGDFKYAQEAIKYNVREYILKPIEESELTRALTELRGELEGELEKRRTEAQVIRSKADDTIRRFMRGEANPDTASFAARAMGCTGRMLFAMVEILEIRQWLSEKDNAEIQASLDEIHRSILAVVGRENALCVLREDPSLFYILAGGAVLGRYQGSEADFCRRLQAECSARGKYRIVVYAGKTVGSPEKLKESYESCVYARDRNFFERSPGTMFYEEVKNRSFRYNLTGEIPYANLLNAVVSGKRESLRSLADELFRSLREKDLAPDVVRACIVSLMLDVVKAISEKNGDADGLFSQFNINSLQAMTAEELKEKLLTLCVSCADYIKSLKETKSAGIVSDVEEYIRRNYRCEINLKSIAERFFIHPVYLGHQFKKVYGVYLNDYIHKLRIDEAGRLLEATDWKVQEIARTVGYADPDYFIRKFKIATGMSPLQFRSAGTGNTANQA